ncbi:MAG: TetR/AcrR family transcriptional regulator [Planctomycetota bacterium]
MAKKRSASLGTAQRIIESATKLFLDEGYGNTNLDDVASAAGVTKPTVYSHFGSKSGLLIAITKAHAGARATALSSILEPTGDVRADLTRFGELFLSRIMGEQSNCWHRLAMTESLEHPEIGQELFAAGPKRVIAALEAFLTHEVTEGRLTCPNVAMATEQFMGLLAGLQPIRMMSGQKPLSKAKQKKRCAAAVDTFLAAFGAKP